MAVTSAASAYSQGQGAASAARAGQRNADRLGIYRAEAYNRALEYQDQVSEWQHEVYNATAASLQKSLTGQFASMLDRLNQQRDQGLEQASMYEASRDRSISQLRAKVAGEYAGNSVLLAQQAYEVAAMRQKQTIYKNMDAQMRQTERQMLAMQAQAQSTLNQAMPAPMAPIDPGEPVASVHQPSMMPYLLQGASGALGAAAHYQSLQPGLTPSPSLQTGAINYAPITAPGANISGGWA
tara:strand:- start:180 stop:896 length:717 start_codon:yes stop_codon:yes gene_type:complete